VKGREAQRISEGLVYHRDWSLNTTRTREEMGGDQNDE